MQELSMIDLPPGDSSPLVRGFAACLSTITHVPVDDLFDPTVRPLPDVPPLRGTIEQVALAVDANAPMQLVDSADAVAGRGLLGDRYERGAGTFSPRAASRPGYQLTLIAGEVVDALTEQ